MPSWPQAPIKALTRSVLSCFTGEQSLTHGTNCPPCQRAACNSIALAACCMLVEELVLVDPGSNADYSPLCLLHY